jgi:drug/metabolite transporter (DMT)-like permease
MTPFVILIVIISAFMHAGWNLMARYQGSERDFYLKMLATILVVGLVPAVVSEYLTRSMTTVAWLCVVGSGFGAAVYLFFLAVAYESSDFTIVYPVVRALPVVFVALSDVLRGRYLNPAGWMGVLLVATGVLFVPLQSFKDISIKKYFNRFLSYLNSISAIPQYWNFLNKLSEGSMIWGMCTASLTHPVPYKGGFCLSFLAVK